MLPLLLDAGEDGVLLEAGTDVDGRRADGGMEIVPAGMPRSRIRGEQAEGGPGGLIWAWLWAAWWEECSEADSAARCCWNRSIGWRAWCVAMAAATAALPGWRGRYG